jgi:DNA-binding NtrC family response regulator
VVCVRNLILFVEDEVLLHLDVESAFETAGFRFAGVLCCRDAEHVLATRPAEICALVTDVDLGGGPDGWEVARRARRAIPHLPVVYASGGGMHDFAAEGVADARFVSKPYAPDHLARVARTLLAGASSDGLSSRDGRCSGR